MADEQIATTEMREFSGVNLTDTRTSIEDKEFAWLENAIPIGKGNLKLVPGAGASIATIAAGVSSLWGFSLTTNTLTSAVLISVNTDGSMNMVDTAGANTNTVIAAAGTVTTQARLTLFKSAPVLIIDPVKGYLIFDGTKPVFVQSATILGTDIATFEGRTWIANGRTITFTAPNSFTDFTAANGAGSSTVTDSVFPGSITRLLSALEQLYVVGPGAVNAISNVQTAGTPLITTFSNTNLVSNVGSVFPSSVNSFFRTFLFLAPYGVYAIVGATPQKLSDKLDGLFPLLQLGADAPSAVGTVHNVYIWCVLVPYVDPVVGLRSLLLCFTQGKWFFASSTATTLVGLTQVLVNGQPDIFTTDGTNVFQLFANTSTAVTYLIRSKLFDMGSAVTMKKWLRFRLELQSSNTVAPTVTLENEASSTNIGIIGGNAIVFIGTGAITFIGTAAITFLGTGLQLLSTAANVQILGQYLGWTLSGTDPSWTMSQAAMQVDPQGQWVNLRG